MYHFINNNIVTEARLLGLRLKKISAKEYAGSCPKCGGKDRFLVFPGSEMPGGNFWCRQCEYKGDGIQLARDLLKLNYVDACQLYGITPEKYSRVREWQPVGLKEEPVFVPDPVSYSGSNFSYHLGEFIADNCTATYHAAEQDSALLQRGIRPYPARHEFRVFCNPVDHNFAAWQLDLTPEDVGDIRGWRDKKFCLPKGIVIPIYSGGQLVSIKVRRTDYGKKGDKGPKYLVLKGSGHACGVFHPEPEGLPIVLVESELDAVLIHQKAGNMLVPISLGSATNKPDQVAHQLILDAPAVLIALDMDEAGDKGWGWFKKTYGDRVYRACLPKGIKSAGDYAIAGGDLREWLRLSLILAGHYALPHKPFLSHQQELPYQSAMGEFRVQTIFREFYKEPLNLGQITGRRRLRNLPSSLSRQDAPYLGASYDMDASLEEYLQSFPEGKREIISAECRLEALSRKKTDHPYSTGGC